PTFYFGAHVAKRQFMNFACTCSALAADFHNTNSTSHPKVPFYCIKAQYRGKEVRLTLTPIKNDDDGKHKPSKHQSQQPIDVVFRFGMSGFFRFTSVDDLPKHAHLRFYTKESPRRMLSFEDKKTRFIGLKSEVCSDWPAIQCVVIGRIYRSSLCTKSL
uniref:Formamidopyrimidine-DNA glycosylase catalytic domain-containing protein n=1 Tax=Sinocyclocheilus anshuiensis TaxID=1608454 RepID=A0A671NKS8_9TELE